MYAIFVADNSARGSNRNFMRLLNSDGIAAPSGSNPTANGAFKGGNGIALGRFARLNAYYESEILDYARATVTYCISLRLILILQDYQQLYSRRLSCVATRYRTK